VSLLMPDNHRLFACESCLSSLFKKEVQHAVILISTKAKKERSQWIVVKKLVPTDSNRMFASPCQKMSQVIKCKLHQKASATWLHDFHCLICQRKPHLALWLCTGLLLDDIVSTRISEPCEDAQEVHHLARTFSLCRQHATKEPVCSTLRTLGLCRLSCVTPNWRNILLGDKVSTASARIMTELATEEWSSKTEVGLLALQTPAAHKLISH